MGVSYSISSNLVPPRPDLGFGETIPGQNLSATTRQKAHNIGVLILIAGAILLAGAFIGCLIALPIAFCIGSMAIIGLGVASGGGVSLLSLIGIAIFGVKNRHQPAISTTDIANPAAPKLGQFTKNHILSTEHVKESSEWKLDLIKNAEKSIELSGNFCGGKLFREALDIIDATIQRSKAKNPNGDPKLKVHVTASENLVESEDRKKIELLRKKWPKNFHYLETNIKLEISPVIRSIENHAKIIVVDEKYFVTGGSGIQEEMGTFTGEEKIKKEKRPFLKNMTLAEAYRDMDFVGEGPLAKTFRVEFFKLWRIWSHKMGHQDKNAGYYSLDPATPACQSAKWEKAKASGDVVKDVQTKALISDPEKPNAITEDHINLLNTAKKTVKVSNLAFNSCTELHNAFHGAVHRGAKVTLVTNGNRPNNPFNHTFFVRANYPNYLPLLMGRSITKLDTKTVLSQELSQKKNAPEICEYAVPLVMNHTKATVIDENDDDAVVIGGSYNYSIKSHGIGDRGCDYEVSLTMKSKILAQRVAKRIDKDAALSKKLTFDDAYELYHHKGGRFQAKHLATFIV